MTTATRPIAGLAEVQARLLRNVSVNENGCFVLPLPNGWKGYGTFRLPNGYGSFKTSAHRASYFLFKGQIPDGMFVCHTCDNKACINPQHLWLGTASDNSRDCVSKGRWTTGKLSAAQVKEIREKYVKHSRGGVSRLAKEYGVSRWAIRDIGSGDSWGWYE